MNRMMGNPPICSLLFQQASKLQEVHGGKSSSHLGEEKTLAKLTERFYLPGMTTSVHEWCQTCHSCMSSKRSQQTRRGDLENVKAGYPLEIIAMDIVGPLPTSKSGKKYIIVISEYFTKWAEAFGIPNQETITVVTKLVDDVFCRLSMPTQLHSDMGAQFEFNNQGHFWPARDKEDTHNSLPPRE